MSLTATIYTFDVSLSHVDRSEYEQLAIRAACHPSESEEYLLTRVLAYCLEYTDGIAFSRGGIADPTDPAITAKDLTGAWKSWIEVGSPDAARPHLARKASPRVALYSHKEPRLLLRDNEERIHKAEMVEVYAMDRECLAEVSEGPDHRNRWTLSVNAGDVYLDVGGRTLETLLNRLSLP